MCLAFAFCGNSGLEHTFGHLPKFLSVYLPVCNEASNTHLTLVILLPDYVPSYHSRVTPATQELIASSAAWAGFYLPREMAGLLEAR